MRLKGILITLIILVSLIPAWHLNKFLQKIIQPRKSFAQLIFYMLVCFALVFFYTFLITVVIFKLFPPQR